MLHQNSPFPSKCLTFQSLNVVMGRPRHGLPSWQFSACYDLPISTYGQTRDRQTMVIMFGCQHGRAPPYLIDYCLPVSDVASRQHLRSASRRLLVVPRHRLSTYGRRAFAVAGPTAWNSFPDNLWDLDVTTDNFKRLLKTFLFSAYQCN